MFAAPLTEKLFSKRLRRFINSMTLKELPELLQHRSAMVFLQAFRPFNRTVIAGTHTLQGSDPLRLNVRFTEACGVCIYMPTYLRSHIENRLDFASPTLHSVYPYLRKPPAITDRSSNRTYDDFIVLPLLMLRSAEAQDDGSAAGPLGSSDSSGSTHAPLHTSSKPELMRSCLLILLYTPIVQAIAKELPIFIHNSASTEPVLKELRSIGFHKVTLAGNISGHVLYPEDLTLNLYDDIERPILLNAGPTGDKRQNRLDLIAPYVDKAGVLHRKVQTDRDIEYVQLASAYASLGRAHCTPYGVMQEIFDGKRDAVFTVARNQLRNAGWKGLSFALFRVSERRASASAALASPLVGQANAAKAQRTQKPKNSPTRKLPRRRAAGELENLLRDNTHSSLSSSPASLVDGDTVAGSHDVRAQGGADMGARASKPPSFQDETQYANACQMGFPSGGACVFPSGVTSGFIGGTIPNILGLVFRCKVPLLTALRIAALEKFHRRQCGDPKNSVCIAWAFGEGGQSLAIVQRISQICDLEKSFLYTEGTSKSEVTLLGEAELSCRSLVAVEAKAQSSTIYTLLRNWHMIGESKRSPNPWAHTESEMDEAKEVLVL